MEKFWRLPFIAIGISFFAGMLWAYYTVYGIADMLLVLRDWQGLIAGTFAIVAAIIGAKAISGQTNKMIEADRERIRREKKERFAVPLGSVNNISLILLLASEGESTELSSRVMGFADFKGVLTSDHTFREIGLNAFRAVTYLEALAAKLAKDPTSKDIRTATNKLSIALYRWSTEALESDEVEDFEFGDIGQEVTRHVLMEPMLGDLMYPKKV